MGKKWQNDRKKDRYYKQAKENNYRARSSYKLKQINKKFKIIKPGNVVVDLGAAPGGWLQVAREIVGEEGFVVGVDLVEIEGFEEDNIVTFQEDMTGPDVVDMINEVLPKPVDVVVSDASPDISGVWDIDHFLSVELSRTALGLALSLLSPKGNFLVKVFQGNELKGFTEEVKRDFGEMRIVKPEASLNKSSEVYILGRDLLDTPVKFGDKVRLRIERKGRDGDGVGFVEGFPIFVEGAHAGDEVDIRVKRVTRRFAKGKLI